MAKTKIGKVGMTLKGTYSNAKNYVRLDVVTENGSSYVCLKDCTGKDVTDTEYWQLVAEKGDKGDKPVNGTDYNTDAEKTEFKNDVVTETKTDIADYVTEQKTELNTYTETKKIELDEYESTKETELNTNATSKTKDYNDNATAKTTDFDNNATEKTTAYNDNATAKLEEYNENATNKVTEFNNNVDSIENELTELAKQMPWNTTEKQDSIHIEDSAKYSRNKLNLFGNLMQEKYSGRNKIPTEWEYWESGHYDANGLKTTYGSRCRLKELYPVQPNTVYYVDLSTSESSGYTVIVRGFDLDKVFNESIGQTKSKNTFTTGENTYYIAITIGHLDTATAIDYEPLFANGTIKPFMCLNSETDKNFEVYVGGEATPNINYPSMPVVATGVQKITKLGKNYLNLPDTNLGTVGGATIKIENNKIILNGTVTNSRPVNLISNLNITLNNTYTFSQKELSGSASNGVYRISLSDENTSITDAPLTFTSKTCSATNTIDTKVTQLRMYLNTGIVFDNYTIQLQLEKGDVSTEFEPYQEEKFNLDLGDTELCKIVDNSGNVVAQDRIVYRENKWQFEKNVEKIILNGTENWVRATVLEENYRFVGNVYNTIIPKQNEKANIICDKYITVSADDTAANIQGIAIATSGKMVIYDDRFNMSSVTSFKNELSVNNVTVYSPLMMSTYEDCTPEQSEVLNKLYKLSLQQGVNNIFVESENGVTTELQLEYMQDLNSKLNQLEAMIVSNASEEVTQ